MWLFASLITAFFAGSSDALSKYLIRTRDPKAVAFLKAFWGTLFLLPLFFFAHAPNNPRVFWMNCALAMPLEILAALLLQKSLQISPLSTSIPFMAFTPVFLLGLGWVFLGEIVTVAGVIGVVCVATGAFLLISDFGAPAFNHKGPLLMMIVALLYAITSVFAKKALLVSSPLFFSAAYYPFIALGVLPFSFSSLRGGRVLFTGLPPLIAIGLCEAASFVIQFHAFLHVEVAYVIAIKRLSLLLALLYGRVFFDEKLKPAGIMGGVLMVVGAGLVTFAR